MADKYAELIKTGLIDEPIFSQNLEMDDDQVVRDFSFELVNEFFQQAREKFVEMDEALETKDLGLLRDIGHFLKGSSSGIGFTQLQETFGKIDNIGKGLDERGQFSSESEETRLGLIAKLLRIAKAQYNAVAVPVQRFYGVDRFDEEARTPVPVGSAA